MHQRTALEIEGKCPLMITEQHDHELRECHSIIKRQILYVVTMVVAGLGWVDLNFDIPQSAKFC